MDDGLKEIRVYGRLAKFLGRRRFMAAVSSAAEAVRFLTANFPKVEGHMQGQHYKVTVGGYNVGKDELQDPCGQQSISIVPVLAGAGGVVRVIAGVALVAGAFLIGQPWLGAMAFKAIVGIGTSLVLGGVAQMLTPTPRQSSTAAGKDRRKDDEKDPRESYSFSGVQNTSRSGVPVPIVYGEMLVGSVVISSSIDTVNR